MENPQALAVAPNRQIIVVDAGSVPRVLRIHPDTGDHTVIAEGQAGGASGIGFPNGVAVEADGNVVVVDAGQDCSSVRRVLRLDPVTGQHTIVSGGAVGHGPDLQVPVSIAVEPDGNLIVVEGSAPRFGGLRALLRVDPVTGNRLIVSDANIGSGPAFIAPTGVAIAPDGHVVVVDAQARSVLHVDRVTGERRLVSGGVRSVRGNGPPLLQPQTITIAADGHLVVVEGFLGTKALIRIDPVTGDRTFLAK